MKKLGLLLIWFVVSSCSYSESFIMGQCETRGVESEWCKKHRKEFVQQYAKKLPDYQCDPGVPPRSKDFVDVKMVNDAIEQKTVYTTWYIWAGYGKVCHNISTLDLEYKVIDKYKTDLFTAPTVFIDRSMEASTIDNIIRHYQIYEGKYGRKLPLGIENKSEFYANKVLRKNYKKNAHWSSSNKEVIPFQFTEEIAQQIHSGEIIIRGDEYITNPNYESIKNRKPTPFDKVPLAKPMSSAKRLEYLKNSDFLSFRRCGKCAGTIRLELCIRKYEQHYEKPITWRYVSPRYGGGCRQWD